MPAICPCKDCTSRHIKCHATCEAYIEWAKNRADAKEWLKKKNDTETPFNKRCRRCKQYKSYK